MMQYRLILGLKPDLSVDKQKKILGKVKDVITDAGGKVGEVESKGLTKLAYPVAGFTEVSFTTVFLTIPGEGPEAHQPLAGKIKSLQKELRVIKEILRMMFVREEVKDRA